jgi:hypothetical protein
LLLVAAAPAQAYIGPGAGFALLSSFLVVFTTIILAVLSLLTWPFRTLWRMARRRQRGRPWIKRLVVVGFDGQDPVRTERMLAEGKLPNFQKLADRGCYTRLRTTYPSISPVAWSSFSTGVEPAKHRMFDFLEPDRKSYLPLLASTRIGPVTRVLKLGRFRIPLQKPEIRLTRGSKAFWSILGEANTWSTVLRVPITFPPEKFYRRRSSTGPSCRQCAPPTCWGPRGRSSSSRRGPGARSSRRAAPASHSERTGAATRARSKDPRTPFSREAPL